MARLRQWIDPLGGRHWGGDRFTAAGCSRGVGTRVARAEVRGQTDAYGYAVEAPSATGSTVSPRPAPGDSFLLAAAAGVSARSTPSSRLVCCSIGPARSALSSSNWP